MKTLIEDFKADKNVLEDIEESKKIANNLQEFLAYCFSIQNAWANSTKNFDFKNQPQLEMFKDIWKQS